MICRLLEAVNRKSYISAGFTFTYLLLLLHIRAPFIQNTRLLLPLFLLDYTAVLRSKWLSKLFSFLTGLIQLHEGRFRDVVEVAMVLALRDGELSARCF